MIFDAINGFVKAKDGITDNRFQNSIQQDIKCLTNFADAVRGGLDPVEALERCMIGASTSAVEFAKKTDFKNLNASVNDALPALERSAAMYEEQSIKLDAQSKSLITARRLIEEYNNGCKNLNMSQEEFVKTIQKSNPLLGNYLAGVKNGEASFWKYGLSLAGATLKTVGLQVATTALNAAITFGASVILTGIVTAIAKWHKSAEELEQQVGETTTAYNQQMESVRSTKKEIEQLAPRYAKLSKGVNTLGENVSLSEEEFKEYNEVVDRIAEISPNLVQGWSNEGHAILGMRDNVDALTESWKEAAKAANDAMIANSSVAKGVFDQKAKDLHKDPKYGKLNYDAAQVVSDILQSKDIEDAVRNIVNEADPMSGIGDILYNFFIEKGLDFDISTMSDYEGTIAYITEGFKQFRIDIEAAANEQFGIASTTASPLQGTAMAYLENAFLGGQYSNISNRMQTLARHVVSGLTFEDFEKIPDIGRYVQNFVSTLNELQAEDQASIVAVFDVQTQFNNGDCSVQTYIDTIAQAKEAIAGIGDTGVQERINLALGLDTSDFDSKYEYLTKELTERGISEYDAKEFIDQLNNQDFEVAVSIVWDQDPDRVKEELKRLQEGGNVDLLNRPVVTDQAMRDRGWADIAKGDATVYTETFTDETGKFAANFTPIRVNEDGSTWIFDPDRFTQYAEAVMRGDMDDVYQLRIGMVYEGDDAKARAEADAERIHELHEMMLEQPEGATLDWLVDEIEEYQVTVNNVEPLKFAELVGEDSEYYKTLDGVKDKAQTLVEALASIQAGTFTPEDGFALLEEFPIDISQGWEKGISDYLATLKGAKSDIEGESTGIFAVFDEMRDHIDPEDTASLESLNMLETMFLSFFNTVENGVPVFETLEDAMSGVSDAASLYKQAQEEIAAGSGLSFDTIKQLTEQLGKDIWSDLSVDANGHFQITEAGLEKLKTSVFANLGAMENAPKGFMAAMEAAWTQMITGAEESQTALEKLQDAFGKMSSISDFMTEMGSGELGFIEQLEAGVELLDDLPEGTKLSDIFSFDSGRLATNTAFLNKQTNEYIKTIVDAMELEGLEAKQMEATLRGRAAQTRQMERYSNVMDKTSDASSILTKAHDEMNESGKNSVDTFSELIDLFGTEAFTMATIGADGIVINQQAVKDKMRSEIDQVFGDNALGKQLKNQLEVEIETASFDDALDNYTSKTETLKDALDTLKTEELSEADYFELIREFPELTKYTDDLSTGIKTLLSQNVDEISKAFDTQIDLADTPEKVAQLQELKRAALELAALEDVTIVIDVEAETEGFEKLQTAISESASATGMSADSVEALRLRYSGLMGELGAGVELFQRTANGITLNTQAAQKLERAYQKQNLDRVDRELQSLTEQYDALNDAILSTNDVAEIDSLYNQRNGIAKQIQELAELRSQYAGLTSSFNAWQSAQSSANERDNYESVGSGYEEMKKLFDGGWYGDDSLNSYLDLMFGADRQKDIQSMTAQMQKLGKMNERYWTKDKDGNSTTDGLFNFLDDIEKNKALEGIVNKTGKKGAEAYSFDFSAENIEKISNAFGMSAEMVGLFASALSDAGGNVVFFDEYTDKLVGVEQASESTKSAIQNMATEAGKSVKGMPQYSIDELDSSGVEQAIKDWEDYKKTVSDNAEIVNAINAEQERLGRKAVELEVQTKIDGGTSLEELSGMTDEQLAIEFGVDINTEEGQAKLDQIKQQIQSMSGAETAITVKIDEGQLAELTKDDKEGTVTYTVDSAEVDAFQAPPKDGVVTYSPAMEPFTPPTLHGTIVYTSQVSGGGTVNGTAHANGTAHGMAFARGNLGTPSSGMALGGELGQETIVRDGQFFTIGDHGAEFFQYQKGDIIFNHKQTEELFKYGYVTSGGGRGKAYADGTAKSGRAFFDGYQSSGNGLYRRPNSTTPAKKPNKSNDSSGNSSAEKAAEEAKEVFDWIEVAIDRIERAIDTLDLKASSVYRAWTERNKNLTDQMEKLREEIDLQQRGYERYLEEANSVGLEEEWAKLVRDGEIDIDKINDEALVDRISQYTEWYNKALDCRDAVEELDETLRECYQTAFDNVVTQYEGILSVIDHEKDILDEFISQSEELGYLTSRNYYDALMEQEQRSIDQLRKEKTELEASLNTAINSGAIVEGSEAYYEMLGEINDVTLSIEEGNTALIEYNNSIRELEWEVFDLFRDKISNVAKETEFLIDLLGNSDLYDDRGQFNNEGMAVAGLHGMNYDMYMDQADRYADEMRRIEEQLANSPYDQALIERKQELLELQQDSIKAAESEKQAIVDMVEEGINIELEALEELIDKYKDSLDSQKDLYDYQKKIKEQTSEIAMLEKQMAAYQGDTSEESKAKIQEIKASLEEAREDIEDTEYDRYIEDQEELLDKMYEEYEEILNNRLDNVDALIQDMILAINSNADIIDTALREAADKVGYDLTDAVRSTWNANSGLDALTLYNGQVANSISDSATTISGVLNKIYGVVQDMVSASDTYAYNRIGGYASGVRKLSRDEIAWTQENGLEAIIRPSDGAILTPLAKGDSVLNANATASLFDFANNPAEFIRSHMKNNNAIADVVTHEVGGNTYDNEFNIQIALPNVSNYEQFKYAMQHDPRFEQMIRAMTVDRMFGGSSLKKYRY